MTGRGRSRRRVAGLWVLACVAMTVGISGCSPKESAKDFVLDTVAESVPTPPGGKADTEMVAQLSAELTRQEAETAQLRVSLEAKAVEAKVLETARADAQAELDKTLGLLAASRVEHEDDMNFAAVLIPGLFVSGVAGWVLSARHSARRSRRAPARPE